MPKESELNRLTEEDKELALLWIEEEESMRAVAMRIEKPEPEGLGIRTNHVTLGRFVGVWREEALLRAQPKQVERAAGLLVEQEESIQVRRVTISVLQRQPFESAIEGQKRREQREMLRLMLDYEVKVRRLELAEKRLELARRQFEFNAARTALKFWKEFQEIDETEGPDDEDKIREARDVVFVGPNGEKSTVRQPKRKVVNKPLKEGAAEGPLEGNKNGHGDAARKPGLSEESEAEH